MDATRPLPMAAEVWDEAGVRDNLPGYVLEHFAVRGAVLVGGADRLAVGVRGSLSPIPRLGISFPAQPDQPSGSVPSMNCSASSAATCWTWLARKRNGSQFRGGRIRFAPRMLEIATPKATRP